MTQGEGGSPARGWIAAALALLAAGRLCLAEKPKASAPPARKARKQPPDAAPRTLGAEIESLRLAVEDLLETFGARYPDGRKYLARLAAIQDATGLPEGRRRGEVRQLKAEALLANPLLGFGRLLLVKRAVRNAGNGQQLGLPSNHECNSSLRRTGYDNEIAVLWPVRPDGKLTTLYRPEDGGYVGEIDLHWDAERLLVTKSDRESWKVWEIALGPSAPLRAGPAGARQVSRMPADVDSFDACYLPNGRIVFGCTATFQSVPCWHGQKRVSTLYVMEADGSGARQLCFDQDHDFHPCVCPDGQVLFHRWDYTGISHIFLRQLMVMNPDGTGQRAVYGSNSWYPNSLYFPRPIPGEPGRLVCILSGYHGVHRMGQLVLVDTDRGSYGADGLVKRISGRGEPIRPLIRDNLVDEDWPKFLHPYPLSDPSSGRGAGKYFLVSCWMGGKGGWGIYLADVFDNLVLVRQEPGYALLEPVPLMEQPVPRTVAEQVDLSRKDGVVYLHDVHAGPGLAGVPRGTVRSLRILAYHYGYLDLAGPDKVGYGGPWEVMRILGTVPVAADGSAVFRVPACTPLAVQPLDAEGKAVQLMRSWFTLMPGESLSCIGCHERTSDTPAVRLARAMREPEAIRPWYGPARGLDFQREVQPVLDAYCVGCHDGRQGRPDLRSEEQVPGYKGRPISGLGRQRMHPGMRAQTGGLIRYTPAYDALLPYIRRVSIEDDVSLLTPGEYHADTSELVQRLRKGHHGVQPDAEAWDRLITWIDLNAPCHGTWGDVHPHPTDAHRRRMELRRSCGGPAEDPEAVPDIPRPRRSPVKPRALAAPAAAAAPHWPFDATEARNRQAAAGGHEKTIDLGAGVAMKLVCIPAGEFVMGDAAGEGDEHPPTRVAIRQPFWIGACEVTNEQFRRFEAGFDCGYYVKLHARADDQGLPLNGARQPAVRVSWQQAEAFCRWLSGRTGARFALPTEAQWEYACRAGSAAALSFGDRDADFSRWANVADRAYAGMKIATGGVEHLDPGGRALCDSRFDDRAPVTAPVGSYQPNAWGLYDMHGNAAEWTRSAYRPYPYRDDDGRNDPATGGRRVVRGGSFFDRPARCRSALRSDYPAWQRVFNVGFRVACEQAARPVAGSR
jgi:formylglycine-generating enzyme required for sulfatase activity